VVFIVFSFEYFLSGNMFPLDLAPVWLRGVLEWLPFTYELFFPVSIFLEKAQHAALYKGLAIQAGWLVAAWGLARLLWARGLRRYGAVGG
jgi:ABC-2 type transport system permease protein